MSTSSRKPQPTLDEVREILVDFGLPFVVLTITGGLILTGRDSEVKTIFAASAGWLFKSGYTRARRN